MIPDSHARKRLIEKAERKARQEVFNGRKHFISESLFVLIIYV